MKPFDAALARMRKICLTLPDTKETPTWGQPHFRVGEKIFAGLGEEKDGRLAIGFKLERDHADMMVRRPGFWRAPYVGHKGWVSMDAEAVSDWEEVRFLIHESYRLIAPKKKHARRRAAAAPAKKKPSTRPPKASRPRRKTRSSRQRRAQPGVIPPAVGQSSTRGKPTAVDNAGRRPAITHAGTPAFTQ